MSSAERREAEEFTDMLFMIGRYLLDESEVQKLYRKKSPKKRYRKGSVASCGTEGMVFGPCLAEVWLCGARERAIHLDTRTGQKVRQIESKGVSDFVSTPNIRPLLPKPFGHFLEISEHSWRSGKPQQSITRCEAKWIHHAHPHAPQKPSQ